MTLLERSSQRGLASWPYTLATALAMALARGRLAGLFDGVRELATFPDRAIGETTMLAVDASGYVRNYVSLYALLGALAGGLLLVLLAIHRHLAHEPRLESAPEQRLLARLSEVWIALEVLAICRPAGYDATAANVVGWLVAAVGIVLVLRGVLARRDAAGEMARLLADRPLIVAAGLLAMATPFIGGVLLGVAPARDALPPLGWVAAILLAWGWLVAAAWWLGAGRSSRVTSARLLAAGAPLLAVPVVLPLANELQYSLPAWSPQGLARLVLLGLAGAAVALWSLARHLPPTWADRLLASYYFPVTVVAADLWRIYPHSRYLGQLDYFHLGEALVPTQQLFQFARLPLLDILPAHTFSDLAYPTLYSLVHGYHGLDMELWGAWMPELVALVLAYFTVAWITGPVFALLVVAFLPVLGAVAEYYAVVLLPALLLAAAIRRPTRARFALLAASLVGLLAWRIDFGLVGALAAVLVLVGQLAFARRVVFHRFAAAVGGFGRVAVGAIVLTVSLVWLAGRPLAAAVAQLWAFYGTRLVTRTRAELIAAFDAMAVLQYYLLPTVALAVLVAYAGRRLRRRRVGPRLAMMAFLAAFSLMLSVRSLERHSLIEAFNPYLFVFLLALLPLLWSRASAGREMPAARLACLAVLVANAVLLVPSALHGLGRHDTWSVVATDHEPFRFRRWRGDEPRVRIAEDRHRALVRFLGEQLGPGETFFDFSNSPLLYAITGKRFPTYLIPNLVHTGERVQARVVADLLALADAGRLPFVVFKQGHPFWDATDGVPNEVRSYRVAELVYARYEPLARFGDYEVWRERGARPAEELLAPYVDGVELTAAPSPRLHAMQRAPDGPLTFLAGGDDPYVEGSFDLSTQPALDGRRQWLLDVEYASSVAGALQVFFALDDAGFTGEASAWAPLRASAQGRVVIPVPVPEGLHRLADLRFDPPVGAAFTLRRVWLRSTESAIVPLPAEAVTQRFELARLPWVWAQHDPLAAIERTTLIGELLERPAILTPGSTQVLPVGDRGEPPRGRYLEVRARRVGTLQPEVPVILEVAYGDNQEHGVRFEVVSPPRRVVELALPLRSAWRGNAIRSFEIAGGRRVYETIGEDPQLYGVFDLAATRAVAQDEEVHLELDYRTLTAGQAQVFFATDGAGFREQQSAWFATETTTVNGPPATARLELAPAGRSYRVTDLRIDPPDGSLLELVAARLVLREAVFDPYLVRVSTQWGWWSQAVDRLVLSASAPIELGSVRLRGDG